MREGRNCLVLLVAASIALMLGSSAAQALPSMAGFTALDATVQERSASAGEKDLILVADVGNRDRDASSGRQEESSGKEDAADGGKRANDGKRTDSGAGKGSKAETKGAGGADGSGDATSAGSTSAADGVEGTTVTAEASASASVTLEPGQEITAATTEAWSESTVTSRGVRTVATAVAEVAFDGGASAAGSPPRDFDRAALSGQQESRGDQDPTQDALSSLDNDRSAPESDRIDSAALSETVPHW